MKTILLAFLIAISPLAFYGCANQTANMTTTAGSASATVDNPGTIATGASVVSVNVGPTTVVSAITGDNITLAPAATGTGTAQATFQNTVAVQFAQDEKAYTQTVANFLQTQSPIILADVGNAAKLAADLAPLLQSWGLDPSTNGQATVLGNVVKIAAKVATNAASLNSLLTGVSVTGSVPVTTTP